MSADVVVVGGRVAGASTALLLARAGLRVLVVERTRCGSDTLSTHALMRGGVLQLHRWGVLDGLVAAGTPPVRRATFHYGCEVTSVPIAPDADVAALYAPRRTALDAALVRAAEAAGATFSFRSVATELVRDGTGRVVGVVLRDAAGSLQTETAGLVVGADGRDSLVAGQVGAATLAAGRHAAAYLYGYWPAPGVDGYHWFYGDGRSAGVIPTNGGLACVFVAAPAASIAAALRESPPTEVVRRLAKRIDGRLARLVAGRSEGTVRVFRGMPAVLRQAHGPGWALVGDAGWWKDPLSTHGITDALRDAELLARAVVGGGASDRALHDALRDYQDRRDRTAYAMHPTVDRLASHDWDLAEVRRLLRELSSVMADEVELIRALDPAPAGR